MGGGEGPTRAAAALTAPRVRRPWRPWSATAPPASSSPRPAPPPPSCPPPPPLLLPPPPPQVPGDLRVAGPRGPGLVSSSWQRAGGRPDPCLAPPGRRR